MNFTLVTAPTTEPLTLAEVKAHLREDGADEDALIDSLIVAARQHVENVTRRALITQTWKASRRGFRNEMLLAKGNLIAVDAITYVDADGAQQTLSAAVYTADAERQPGRVVLGYGQAWPSVRDQVNNVTITFRAGYGAAAAVPQAIKHAMLLLVGHWFANREAVNVGNIVTEYPLAVDALLAPYRLHSY